MPSRPRNILLVEDHLPDERMVRRAFAKLPVLHSLSSVHDGVEALLYLRQVGIYATAPRPELVLLDLNLPKVTGYDVLEAAKGSELRSIPIVVLSGSQAQEDIAKCFAAGANGYLIKPGSPERLQALVQTLHAFWFDLGRVPEAT